MLIKYIFDTESEGFHMEDRERLERFERSTEMALCLSQIQELCYKCDDVIEVEKILELFTEYDINLDRLIS